MRQGSREEEPAHTVGDPILGIVRGEIHSEEDDDADGVHQPGLDDDVHCTSQARDVAGACVRKCAPGVALDGPYLVYDQRWKRSTCQQWLSVNSETGYTGCDEVEGKGDGDGRGYVWLELSHVEERVGVERELEIGPDHRDDFQIVVSST